MKPDLNFLYDSNRGALCKKQRRQYRKRAKEIPSEPEPEKLFGSGELNSEPRCAFCLSVDEGHTRFSPAVWSRPLSSRNAGWISSMLPMGHS
jgi:hypothetical protein